MVEHELSLEESDRLRLEELSAAERMVLETIQSTQPSSAHELRVALTELDVDQAVVRTALLRLLSQGRIQISQRHSTAAAK